MRHFVISRSALVCMRATEGEAALNWWIRASRVALEAVRAHIQFGLDVV
jgi:hypothetical protein